jgi:hypothetical protein
MRRADTVLGIIQERAVARPSTQEGHDDSAHRHTSLESGVMRKYHAPFGGRPTEKGSVKSTSPAAHPTQCPVVEEHTRRYHVWPPTPS